MKSFRSIFRLGLATLTVLAIASDLSAQTLTRRDSADYSAQPYVVERISHSVKFENDGTFEVQVALRVRIQSPSGIQTWGLIRLPYASSNGDAEIANVRVTKPNGTVVPTALQNIQDMPAQITVAAPFYSDLKEKQLAVRGLDVGDVLEYEQSFHAISPAIPGQFWYAYDFFHEGIILSDELTIRVPQDRYVKVKSPKFQPATTEAGGYRAYTWKTANLKTNPIEENAESSDTPFADVQLTSFRNWDEIAEWYRQLQESRTVLTPALRAKAEELTRSSTSESEKIHVLYDYVALKFRYIGISFGIGRYQPHTAGEVLENGYGDCKDKHTLLAALLAAAGVKSYPAMINSSRNLDPDIPSPNQFDHMITVVGQGSELIWLDTTPGVAPFGMLLANIRDKQALVISDVRPAKLVKTPADPPFRSSFYFNVSGKISDDGSLDARADFSVRGDLEVTLRGAFRNTPEPRWKELVQSVSQSWSFAGTVDDISLSSPESTEDVFSVTYTYTRKNYSRWPDAISPPLPSVNVAELSDVALRGPDPIHLETPTEYALDAKVELPKNVTPRFRPALEIKKDFAEYRAAYSMNSNVLHTERRLVINMREIPKSRSEEYRAFWKAVDDDGNAILSLASAAPLATAPSREESSVDAAVANRIDLGDRLFNQDDLDGAIAQYRKAVELAPENVRAHRALGDALSNKTDYDEAIVEYRQALRLRPEDAEAHTNLGSALLFKGELNGAVTEYREALRLKADNPRAHKGVGDVLFRQRNWDGAIAEYGESVRLEPRDADTRERLAGSLLAKRDLNGAVAEYREAVRLNPGSPGAHVGLGDTLQALQDLNGALAEYREALRLKPDDAHSRDSIPYLLFQQRRYVEAATEFQSLVERRPRDVPANFLLWASILHSGRVEDATPALQRILALDSSPQTLTNVASELADANVHLDDALRYARQALEQQEVRTEGIYLAALTVADLRLMVGLPVMWDTLGWVHFRLGQMGMRRRNSSKPPGSWPSGQK